VAIKVIAPPAWPSLTLNVMDFGADGRGLADDTAAIAEALAQLKNVGGGVLYFPRGRYLVSQTLSIPERTVLRGKRRELSAIAWPDAQEPLPDLLGGTHDFAIEELSFYCANYGNFLSVDLKSPQAGNVRLHRLRVVANRFRGHMYGEAEEMSRRFTRFGVHGGKLLALGGENVEVRDCDLLSSGCALFLTRARGARIADNVFRMGRFGWFWLSGSDGVIFENNQCLGQDLSTWGGGINCLDGSTVSQHVYFARNTCSQWFGGDNELTTDGSGGAYYGKLTAAEGTRLTTADEPKWGQRDWRGAAVLVIGGRGVGQCRRVARTEGRQIEIDRPWKVVPDTDSQITITMYQGDYLLVDNRFSDIGVIQFYGMSLNHICAGNAAARTAGFFNHGHELSPHPAKLVHPVAGQRDRGGQRVRQRAPASAARSAARFVGAGPDSRCSPRVELGQHRARQPAAEQRGDQRRPRRAGAVRPGRDRRAVLCPGQRLGDRGRSGCRRRAAAREPIRARRGARPRSGPHRPAIGSRAAAIRWTPRAAGGVELRGPRGYTVTGPVGKRIARASVRDAR